MDLRQLLPTAGDVKRDPIIAHPSGRGVLMRRFVALVVDLAIVTAFQWLFNQVYGVLNPNPKLGGIGYIGGGIIFQDPARPYLWFPWLLLVVVVYFVALEGLFGATLGKLLVGLRVVTTGGGRPGWRAILIRNLLRPVDALPFLNAVGVVSIWTSPLAQRVGDRLANTLVAPPGQAEPAARKLTGVWWRLSIVALGVAVALAASGLFYRYKRPPLVAQGVVNGIQMPLLNEFGQPIAANGCGVWSPGPDGTWHAPRNVTEVSVGRPQQAGDRITYPIQYRVVNDARLYQGTITLHWMGYFEGGWVVEQAQTTC